MKSYIIAAGISLAASTAFADTPQPYCDHFEVLGWTLETEHGMKKISGSMGSSETYQDKSGTDWVVKYYGEEACLEGKAESKSTKLFSSMRPMPKPSSQNRQITFRFDGDGGKCDIDGALYAEFGVEGMVYVSAGGSRYVAEGNFAFSDAPKQKNGVTIFPTKNEWGYDITFVVDASGRFSDNIEYASNPDLMQQEGQIDVAVMKPCN